MGHRARHLELQHVAGGPGQVNDTSAMARGRVCGRRAPEEATLDLEQERRNLERRDAPWSALASEGRDVEAILSYWAEDAIVIPPGLPTLSGKDALRRCKDPDGEWRCAFGI